MAHGVDLIDAPSTNSHGAREWRSGAAKGFPPLRGQRLGHDSDGVSAVMPRDQRHSYCNPKVIQWAGKKENIIIPVVI